MAHDDPHHFEDIHQALHRHLPSEPALRVKALESLLIEKGMLDPKAVDAWIAVYTEEIGPKRGATMVAKAWLDPDFRARLLADGTAAISELGFEGWAGAHFKVVENTPAIHNMVVAPCAPATPTPFSASRPTGTNRPPTAPAPSATRAACSPSLARSSPANVAIRVWDSTSELRYMVLPERPPGTEGWSEADLTSLVTRNA